MREIKSTNKILVGKFQEKRSQGRHRRRWEDIKMELHEEGREELNWLSTGPSEISWEHGSEISVFLNQLIS
jgi:hypothetical protein